MPRSSFEDPLYSTIRGAIKSALDAHPSEVTTSSIAKRIMGGVSSWRCPQSSHDSFSASWINENGGIIRHTHVSEVESKEINRTVTLYLRNHVAIDLDGLATVLCNKLETSLPTPVRTL